MPERLGRWDLLGRDGDPVVVDVPAIDERVEYFRSLAESMRVQGGRLARIGSGESLRGEYADELRESAGAVAKDLSQVVGRYEAAVRGLTLFRPAVDAALVGSAAALDEAMDAAGEAGRADALPEVVAVSGEELSAQEVEQNAARDAAVAAAAGRLSAAKARLGEVLARFDEAGREAAGLVRSGFDDGLTDSWVDKLVAFFKKFLKILIEVLTYIGIALAVLAMLIPGVGPLLLAGAVLGAVAFVAEVALVLMGEGSWLDLGLAILGMFSGGLAKTIGPAIKSGFRGAMQSVRGGRGANSGIIGGARRVDDVSTTTGSNQPRIRDNNPGHLHDVPVADRVSCADPIDVATGAVMLEQTDVSLPGALPLLLTRTHLSTYRVGRLFGPTWTSTLDERIEVEIDGLHLALADGTLVRFPLPRGAESVMAQNGPYLALRRVGSGFLVGTPRSSEARFFMGEPGESTLPLRVIADGMRNRIVVHYTEGLPTAIEHSGGYRIEVEYVDGRITEYRMPGVHDPLARFTYDAERRLVGVTDAVGTPQRFSYDDDGRIIGWEDVNDRWYRYEYDTSGRCVRAHGMDGYLSAQLSFDDDNRVTTVTDSLGAATRYQLDAGLRVVGETDALGHTTILERDRFGHVTSETDPLGNTTRWEYDGIGNLVAVVHPDGSRTETEYDDDARPVVVTNPDGAQWRYEYDDHGSLGAVVDPAGARRSFTYDPVTGATTSVTDPTGAVTRLEVDGAGRVRLVREPGGAAWEYEYDDRGNLARVIDPGGNSTTVLSDAHGAPTEIRDADGELTRFLSTAVGNQETRIDERGGVHRTRFGAFDLPISDHAADGGTVLYGYDTELQLTTFTNELAQVWTYEYDAVGRQVSETDYDGRILRAAYDPGGELVGRENAAGQRITLERDALGRVVRRVSADEVAVYTYDAAGRMLTAANESVEVRYAYDAVGRVIEESIGDRVVSSAYDAAGRRVSRRTSSGHETEIVYDSDGRPLQIAAFGRAFEFEYDAVGREVGRVLRGDAGHVAELRQKWTPAGRLAAQTVRRSETLLQQRQYTYLPDGHLAGTTDLLGGDRAYDVDAAGRVVAVRGKERTEEYEYDAAGRVISATGTAPSDADGPREYDGTLLTSAGSSLRYTYDAAGRVVSRAVGNRQWHYEWSAENRLIGVRTPGGDRWRYRYDPFGRRVAKERLDTPSGAVVETVEFLWDGDRLIQQVHRTPGIPEVVTAWEYLPGEHTPIAQTTQERGSCSFLAVISDLVGAPTELLSDGGELVGHSRTTLWGLPVEHVGTATSPLRFPGQYADDETGLFYNRYRFYDPATGRYISHDPLGLQAGPDPFAYVVNPTVMIDPLGLMAKTAPCAAPTPSGSKSTGASRGRKKAGHTAPNPSGQNPVTSAKKKASKGVGAPPTQPAKPIGAKAQSTRIADEQGPGTYGWRDVERNRLEAKYDGFILDGNRTHQSEHAIGYDILANNRLPREGASGKVLEGRAPAYYEDFANHRNHPGTGTSNAAHPSGFTGMGINALPNDILDKSLGYSDRLGSYRAAQRDALEANEPSTAIQLNQLGYAHQNSFTQNIPNKAGFGEPERRTFTDRIYHGDDANHIHHRDHPLHDPVEAAAAKEHQALWDDWAAKPVGHSGRDKLDRIRGDLTRADDSYLQAMRDLEGKRFEFIPEAGASVPTGGKAIVNPKDASVIHHTTRPMDMYDVQEVLAAREAARTGKWPVFKSPYPDEPTQEWKDLAEKTDKSLPSDAGNAVPDALKEWHRKRDEMSEHQDKQKKAMEEEYKEWKAQQAQERMNRMNRMDVD